MNDHHEAEVSAWHLADAGAVEGPRSDRTILWTAPPATALGPLMSGLLPNRDHNGHLTRLLGQARLHPRERPEWLAIFAADPFIAIDNLVSSMRAAGYSRVVNWPSTAQYGPAFWTMLDSVNLGPAREMAILRRLAAAGLRLSATVAAPDHVETCLELSPDNLFVTPDFEGCYREGRLDDDALLDRCAAIAAIVKGRVPLILMADPGSVSEHQARSAGAHALLLSSTERPRA